MGHTIDPRLSRKPLQSSPTSPKHHSKRQNALSHFVESAPNDAEMMDIPSSPGSESSVNGFKVEDMGNGEHSASPGKRKHDKKRKGKSKRTEKARNSAMGEDDLNMDVRESSQAENLPIHQVRWDIVNSVRNNQITLIIGETGCGKTTQVPQILHSANFSHIGITQPRRVATVTLASRVAAELHTSVGDLVGYKVRFEQKHSAKTRITFLTDGTLLREFQNDEKLQKYDVLVMDEAHERSVRSDVCLGMLKKIARQRPDFKVVIMSATLQEDIFHNFFDGPSVIRVPGRSHPVQILHLETPSQYYQDNSLARIAQIHLEEPAGDILVFLTGQDEIDSLCRTLREFAQDLKHEPQKQDILDLTVVALYGALTPQQQLEAFAPMDQKTRKVVLATNVAETSVTVPGVRYVVDTGLHKIKTLDNGMGVEALKVRPIAKASAVQRAGRAGREAPGICWRLYTKDELSKREDSNVPEILRCSLTGVVLELKALGVKDVLTEFDFVTRPEQTSLKAAHDELKELGALDAAMQMTVLGVSMAKYPVEPRFAKVLCTAKKRRLS